MPSEDGVAGIFWTTEKSPEQCIFVNGTSCLKSL